ncbi:MAG: hypothetical protein K1X67_20365 [Fimbriimonadaceae bacterium]|nr:hypothetical protein [Fimbriimonadaceae bacterium]
MDSGTVYLDYSCLLDSWVIDGRDSHQLTKWVLAHNPELSEYLFDAVDRRYPGRTWFSPGGSMIRELCMWVFRDHMFPPWESLPDRAEVEQRLEQVRALMAEAWNTRAFADRLHEDVLPALTAWNDAGFEVVSFSTKDQPDEQQHLFETLVPEPLRPIAFRSVTGADDLLASLADGHPIDMSRSIIILSWGNWELGAPWRRAGGRVVLLARGAVEQPYLDRGYCFNVGRLTDIQPHVELARDYS